MRAAQNLSAKQARFVAEYLVDGNGTQAAIRAQYGVAGAGVAAMRLLKNVYVQAALQAQQSADATRLCLRREDVLAALLEAVDQARMQSNPAAMIAGLREIGKMMGFYAIETKRVEVSAAGQVDLSRLNEMSDAQLLALIQQGTATSSPICQ